MTDQERLALPRDVAAPLAAVGALGASLFLALGMVFGGQATGSGLDIRIAAALEVPPSSRLYGVSWTVQTLADPAPGTVLATLLATVCLLCRRPRLAVLALAGPAVTDVVAIITKQVVERTIHHGSLTYPSTHVAHTVATVMVAALLVTALLRLQPGVRTAVVLGVAAVSMMGMGWALVAASVHYATDIIGAFGLAIFVVPAAARGTDLISEWMTAGRRRDGQPRPDLDPKSRRLVRDPSPVDRDEG